MAEAVVISEVVDRLLLFENRTISFYVAPFMGRHPSILAVYYRHERPDVQGGAQAIVGPLSLLAVWPAILFAT